MSDFKVKKSISAGAPPRPRWAREFTALPRPPNWTKGTYFLLKGRDTGRGGLGQEGEGRGGERRGREWRVPLYVSLNFP